MHVEAFDQHTEQQVQQPKQSQDLETPPTNHWVRRSTRSQKCLKRYSPNFQSSFALLIDDGEPSSFQEAGESKNANKWRKAMDEEIRGDLWIFHLDERSLVTSGCTK